MPGPSPGVKRVESRWIEGFRANRRLLAVERVSYDGILAGKPFSRSTARSSAPASAPPHSALQGPRPLAGTRTSGSVSVAKGHGSRLRSGLAAGGRRIRTLSPALRKAAVPRRATWIPGHRAGASGINAEPAVRIHLSPRESRVRTCMLAELDQTGILRSRSRARRQKSPPQPRNADYGNEASRSSATTRAPAHDDCKIRWQQTQFVEPRRPGPCAGNRQDAAGNRRCMQGRSRQPCRRRAFPAQADGPHRRARWETLRHIPSGHPGP